MGIYVRADSPFYWLLLERPGQAPLKESSKVPRDAPDAMSRKLLKQQAQEVYNARMTDLARARHDLPALNPASITFAKYADWFDKHHLAKRRGKVRDRDALKHLRAFFGTDDITTITRARAHEYMTHRLAQLVRRTKRHVLPNTVNREMSVLKGMLREAVPTYLKVSPLAGMKRLRVVKRKKRLVADADEEARLLAELPPADRAFYIVAVDSLMRLSNLVNLRRSEDKGARFDLDDSKTGPYSVPISARARAALDSLPERGEYYFPHRRRAKTDRDRRGAVRTMLQRACARAGITYGRIAGGITFHTATRATGATRMLRKGFDQRTVQGVGNWKDIRAMQEYLETTDELMHRAVNESAPELDITAAVATAQARARARRVAVATKGGKARAAKARLRITSELRKAAGPKK